MLTDKDLENYPLLSVPDGCPTDAQILACNGDPDEPTISGPDADLIAFGRAVLALVDDPHKIEREAHFALQDRMFFKSEQPRVRALQDAIEGELDGLGISNEKAEAILRHIDKEAPGKPRAWAVFAENRNLRIWSTDGEGIRKYAKQHNLPLTPLYDHPVGSPLAYRTTQVCHRCLSPDGRHWDGRECWLCKHYPLPKRLDVEGLARQSDCVHVDLNGDRAKSIERLSDFAALVRSATCSISDKEIERIAGRDELTGDAILRFARDLLAFASGELALRSRKNPAGST